MVKRKAKEPPSIRDRIVELRRVKAADILPNPSNYRTHPETQRAALRGILGEVGIADALLARETPEGLMLIDGHLRREELPDTELPVLVLDVTEEEADKILLTLDPLAQMAEMDTAAARALLEGLTWGSTEGVQSLLDDIAAQANEIDGIEPPVAIEEEMPRTRKLGAPILSYNLVFDNDDQQQRWFLFLRQIREKYQGETIAGRLDAFLTEQWSD